ncbi:MAG: GTP-binding protein, partial [Gammaproteobacteria bacterium]|nr:GTP-binding protein [Gammaproteobacteria bacterium]
RMVTSDIAGTTRDSVATPFERRGRHYTLIDTAGIRRRSRVTDTVEKFSVVTSLKSIDMANVTVLVLDAHETITEQDASLLGLILDSGRALVIAVNKWDGLDDYAREQVRRQLSRKLHFIDFAETLFISALHGTGVGHLFEAIDRAWESAMRKATTGQVNAILEHAVSSHPPPLVRGRRIKLRYAHIGGSNPPTIVVHGNQTVEVPASYQRYLASCFRDALQLTGTPVRIEFRQSENPFAGRRNKLNKRQLAKRKRMIRHRKS